MKQSVRTLSILAAALLGGCAARPRLLLPGESFRIEDAPRFKVLLPPPTSNADPKEPLRLALGAARAKSARCEAARSPFRLHARDRQWLLELPPAPWWSDRGVLQVAGDLRPFLSAISALPRSGCMSAAEAEHLRRAIVDALPTRLPDSLSLSYGFPSPGGVVDLRPEMRLLVVRVWKDGAKYSGTTRETYELHDTGRGAIRLSVPERSGDTVAAAAKFREWRAGRTARVWRLHLFTNLVKANRERAAMVVGAPSGDALAAASAAIFAKPDMGCAELVAKTKARIECLVSQGLVSVAPEIRVTVNGEAKYVVIGTLVRGALPGATPPKSMRRIFEGSPREVRFVGDEVLALPLAAGDELTL